MIYYIYKLYIKGPENICYVGSTINIKKRLSDHKKSLKDYDLYRYRDALGWDIFEVEILDTGDTEINDRFIHEQKWIADIKPILNTRRAFCSNELKAELARIRASKYYLEFKDEINEERRYDRLKNIEEHRRKAVERYHSRKDEICLIIKERATRDKESEKYKCPKCSYCAGNKPHLNRHMKALTACEQYELRKKKKTNKGSNLQLNY